MTTTNENKGAIVVKDRDTIISENTTKELLFSFGLENKIKNYLTKEEDRLKFISSIAIAIYKEPKLSQCSKPSLMDCSVQSLTLKLYPDGYSGIAWVPYWNKNNNCFEAKLSIDYTAYITLLGRAGIKVNANIVYKNDEFIYEEGDSPRIVHRPNVFDKGEPIGVYAIATDKNGLKTHKVMSKEEVLHIKEKYSKNKGFWDNDPLLNMWKKTAVRQLIKFVYKEKNDDIIRKAVEIDNENDGVIPTQTIQSQIKKVDKTPIQLKENKGEPTEEEQEWLRQQEAENNLPNIQVE